MPHQMISFFRKLLDLRDGSEEKRTIIENVKDDADFSSARFWTLVFAIGVASVGLNINSIPVVIGAMLISPLMGPVVSIGLALSIYDWGLMRRSFRNLLLLTAISITISAIYFALTPITNAQSELLARTQPTIFDVLIAIFGGIAGFIAVSRAKHNNVVPGVAIATALMPPLCTVGYGIATLQPQFIFGAFYLFLINCIFICLSALLVAKYLKLPKREYPDAEQKKRVNRIISWIIVIMITPAIYFAFTFVEQNNFNQSVDEYIQTTFSDNEHIIIYEKRDYSRGRSALELAFLSEHFTEEQVQEFTVQLPEYDLADTRLTIRQNSFSLTEAEWLSALESIESDDAKVLALEALLESEQLAARSPIKLLSEAQAINKLVSDIAISTLEYGREKIDSDVQQEIALIYTETTSPAITEDEAILLTNWLQTRLENESLITYVIPTPFGQNSSEIDIGTVTEDTQE
jgi:uncharacterized hydrophobic protein (TIGR00271 family)